MLGLIILICIGIITLYLISIQRTRAGTEKFDSEPSLPPMGETYQQKFNELHDVDRVLDRPVKPGNKFISKLEPLLSKREGTDTCLFFRQPTKRLFKFKDIEKQCIPKNHPIYTAIEHKQPYMFTKPVVVDYYGSLNYWDWKYPQKPIDIKFAADPKGFCKKNPNSYPCYVINSRKDLI